MMGLQMGILYYNLPDPCPVRVILIKYKDSVYSHYQMRQESDDGKENRKIEVMKDMGMTDKQFNGFVRFVLDDIKEVLEGMQESKEKEKLKKVADNLQKTLED